MARAASSLMQCSAGARATRLPNSMGAQAQGLAQESAGTAGDGGGVTGHA